MEQDTIKISALIQMVLRHTKMIIIMAIVFAALFFSYAYFFVQPTYTSTGIVIIQNTNNYISSAQNAKENDKKIYTSDMSASASLAENCAMLFKLDSGIVEIADGAEFEILQVEESQFLSFEVISEDADTIQGVVTDMMNRAVEVFKEQFGGAGKIEIKSQASSPDVASGKGVVSLTLLGILAGLFLGVVVALIIEFSDSTIKPDDDLYDRYKVPVFAEIIDFDSVSKSRYGHSSRG